MPDIDPDFLHHLLTMDPKVRPVRQRRRKFNEERHRVIREETQKLLSVGHIREIQYFVDLEELFTTIAKYRLKLNPEKCVFGIEARKFLGFLFTERGTEVNPERCAVTRRMAALSGFVSAGGDKGYPYFQCLRRNNRFVWT